MAMMDNVDFLISHIRNSFVTSDDTSMSEWVITECRIQEDNELAEDGSKRYTKSTFNNRSDSNSDCPSDNEVKGSVDIHPDMDFGAHRRRSNTAQRLDQLKREKRNQVKLKTVQWKDAPDIYKPDDRGHLFNKKELQLAGGNEGVVPPIDGTPASKAVTTEPVEPVMEVEQAQRESKLTHLLKELEIRGDNPFFMYAKFDGRTAGGRPTRKMDIFFTFGPAEQQNNPVTINVLANAKAEEVVGLVCWQYTQQNMKPDLATVSGCTDPDRCLEKFTLHLAEDDGDLDTDFPPIAPTDPVSKYGFTKFALMANTPFQPKPIVVTIYVPNRGFNKFQVKSMTITMRELMNKVIKKRKVKIRHGLNYTLEKAGRSEAGKPIDLDSQLVNQNCLEFFLIRENSSRGDVESNDEEDQKMAETLMSHHYKSFIVSMVHKLRTNTEVQLGISGDKIEIDPVSMKGTARLFRQKAVTYAADYVAACDVTETKSNGRAVFRLIFLNGHDYKHHYFEADQNIAVEIVAKVNNILELKFSPVRKEFVFTQEKKALQKRDSIKRDSLRPGY